MIAVESIEGRGEERTKNSSSRGGEGKRDSGRKDREKRETGGADRSEREKPRESGSNRRDRHPRDKDRDRGDKSKGLVIYFLNRSNGVKPFEINR